MKSKPWHTLVGNEARCNRCGGVSVWPEDYYELRTGRRWNYWKWWRRFKQNHVNCPDRQGWATL